jgi:hypothetical protein
MAAFKRKGIRRRGHPLAASVSTLDFAKFSATASLVRTDDRVVTDSYEEGERAC